MCEYSGKRGDGQQLAAKSPKDEANLWAPPLCGSMGGNSAAWPHTLHYGEIRGGDERCCGNGSVLTEQVLLFTAVAESPSVGV